MKELTVKDVIDLLSLMPANMLVRFDYDISTPVRGAIACTSRGGFVMLTDRPSEFYATPGCIALSVTK